MSSIRGDPRLHRLAKEHVLALPFEQRSGNTLVVGASGSGKTHWIITQIEQDIAHGRCVFVIDPKSDRDLEATICRIARRYGRPYIPLLPSDPERSARFDALSETTKASEVASRITRLLPEGDEHSPFKAFAWMVLETLTCGLQSCHETISLSTLQQHVLDQGRTVAITLFEEWLRPTGHFPLVPARSRRGVHQQADQQSAWLDTLTLAYRNHHAHEPVLDKMLALVTHDPVHYRKMTASLIPFLASLTSGPLRSLLSPDRGDPSDQRPVWNVERLCQPNMVTYLALDTLGDPHAGQCVGALFLGELAALASRRYQSDQVPGAVEVYVDEAGELAGLSLIQLLNKGRGSGFHLTLCIQTLADLAARLGSEVAARVVLGNIVHLIVFRVSDDYTQKYCSEQFGADEVVSVRQTHGTSVDRDRFGRRRVGGSLSHSFVETRKERIPSSVLSRLPTGHFVASLSAGHLVKGRSLRQGSSLITGHKVS